MNSIKAIKWVFSFFNRGRNSKVSGGTGTTDWQTQTVGILLF